MFERINETGNGNRVSEEDSDVRREGNEQVVHVPLDVGPPVRIVRARALGEVDFLRKHTT